MNRVRNVVVAVALAALGSGGGAEETTTDGPLEADSALLFEDHYSDTGIIRVYNHREHLSVQVLGGIGSGLDYYRTDSLPAQTWGYYSNNFDVVNYGMQMERGLASRTTGTKSFLAERLGASPTQAHSDEQR